MVKADVKRDYYADLGLSKSADVQEIKKQFKKLALKYHPDRNPGHEEEFNAKFQAIQFAHEILSDPSQKAKYDSDRASSLGYGYGGFYPRPNVPPRNHYANPYAAFTNFPPPPRPPPPRSANTSAYSSHNSAGANRYSGFAGATFAPPRSREESNARMNAKAWENLKRPVNHAQQQTPNPAPFPPPPRRAGAPKTPLSKMASASDGYGEPRNTFATVNRSHSVRTPEKKGFTPATPGGDEPPAPSSYSHLSGNRNRQPDILHEGSSAVPPVPSRPPPRAVNKTDPLSHFRDLHDTINGLESLLNGIDSRFTGLESPRLSTPYATTGGEKTYFSTNTLKRPTTVQDPTRPSPSERHRSASPLGNRHRDSFKTGSPRTNPPTPSVSPPKKSNVPPRSHGRVPSHTRKDGFDHYVPSDTSSDEQKESGYESPTFMERLAAEGRARGRRRGRARHYPYPAYQSPGGQATGVSAGPSDRPPRDSRAEKSDESTKRPFLTETRKTGAANVDDKRKKSTTFTFSVDDSMFNTIPPLATNVRSSSTDNINTRFSPADWHGQFNSNANDYFQPPPIRRKPLHSQSPVKTTFPDHSSTSGVSNQDPNSRASPGHEPFRPEYWTEELKQHRWVPPPTPLTSPKRSAPSRKLSDSRAKSFRATSGTRSTKRSATPRPATVSTDSEGSDGPESPSESASTQTKPGEASPRNDISEGSAMDIDPVTPANELQANDTPATSDGVSGTHLNGTAHTGPVGPGLTEHGTSNRRTKSTTSDSSIATNGIPPPSTAINLDTLKKVEPFITSTGQGLKDMAALSSTLPFASRASSIPTNPVTPLPPRQLQLPKPPRCPPSPPQLTQTTWEQYLATMQVYMYEWNQFVDLMLAHFQERQVETKERLTPSWMSILGEGPKGGYLKYMQGVEEDFRVREHFDVAWEKHREGLWAFGRIRADAVEKALRAV